MHYLKDTIRVNNRTLVALKFVESIGFPEDSDLIIDALKDDLQIVIVTVSGQRYQVSMNELSASLAETESRWKNVSNTRLRESVYNRWIYLLGRENKT